MLCAAHVVTPCRRRVSGRAELRKLILPYPYGTVVWVGGWAAVAKVEAVTGVAKAVEAVLPRAVRAVLNCLFRLGYDKEGNPPVTWAVDALNYMAASPVVASMRLPCSLLGSPLTWAGVDVLRSHREEGLPDRRFQDSGVDFQLGS